MPVNVGNLDRVLRAVLGLFLIAAPFIAALGLNGPILTIALPIVGVVFLGTAAVKFCPIYRVLGMRTCKPS